MNDTVKGMALFCLTMLFLSVLDMLAKYISVLAPAFATCAWRYLLMLACTMCAVMRHKGVANCLLALRSPIVLVRGALLGLFGSLQLQALTLCPLSITMSIVFTMPLFLLILSRLLLKEEVRPYQWCMVAIGFLGVCVIIRPSGDLDTLGVLYAFAAMFSYCLFLALTRKLSGAYGSDELMFSTCLVSFIANAALSFAEGRDLFTSTPFGDPAFMALLLTISVLAYTGSVLTIKSFALADASILAPFNYMQFAFTLLISVAIFHERPDLLTWLGIMAILLSGVGQSLLAGRASRRRAD